MADSNEMLINSLAQLLQSETSPNVQAYKEQILKRIAEESDVKATRIPAPLNITEVGGYFNLIDQVQTNNPVLQNLKATLQLSMIASALGLPITMSALMPNAEKDAK